MAQKTAKSDNWYEILKVIAWTDFKLRYHGSILGFLWTLVKPLLIFAVLYIVFTFLIQFPVEHYQIYLLLAVILWNFFAEATMMGMASLLTKANLISKVYFPRILVVIASTISSLITFLLGFLVFIVFVVLTDISFSWSMLFFPIYLTELYLIILGVSLALSVLYVRFRDLQHIWEILLQVGFWLTPIFYSVSMIPPEYHRFIYLSPVTRIIEYSRTIFIHAHIPSLRLNLIVLMMTCVVFVTGYLVFRKYNRNLIEHL
jgi:lipopolysaccharide transport system permease protein